MFGLKEATKGFFRQNILEIQNSTRLTKYGFVLSLIHFFTFCYWFFHLTVYNDINATAPAICQPFFQSCAAFRFGTPELWRWILVGYFLAGLFGSFLWLRKNVTAAFAFGLFLWVFKIFIYVQDYRLMGNYHYIHFLFLCLFFFIPRKNQIIPAAIVLVYLGAGILKLNTEWISGSALYGDLVIFRWLPVQWATVYVVFLELGLSWLLLSHKVRLKWFALSQFFFFHFFSIQIVGLYYPAVMFCVLSIFWLKADSTMVPLAALQLWKAVLKFKPHLVIVVIFIFAQAFPLLVPGNSALTGEGRLLSLNMFDAKAQCRHTFLLTHLEQSHEQRNFNLEKFGIRIRCEPYIYLQMAERICESRQVPLQRVDFFLDAKLSSEENYQALVRQQDICNKKLSFNPLWRNSWIQIEDPAPSRWKTWHYQDAKIESGEKVFMYRNNEQRTGIIAAESFMHPLSRPFWRKPNWNDNRHTASKASPVSDGTRIFAASDRGVFSAFELDGREIWKWQLSSPQGVHGTPAVVGQAVYFGDYDGILYSQNKFTGALNWLIDLGDAIGSSPLYSEGALFISVETSVPDGYVVKLDAVTGKVLWQSENLGEHAHSSPTLSEDRKLIYVGANNGVLSALDAKTGKKVWHYQTAGPIKGTPMVAENSVFFCSWDKSFYKLDAQTGLLKWSSPLNGRCQSSSSWSRKENLVFVHDSSGRLNAFDFETGKQRWFHQGVGNAMGSPVLILKGASQEEQLLGQCFTHALCLFKTNDGKVIRKMVLGDRITSVPWIENAEMVYSLDGPGGLVKWK